MVPFGHSVASMAPSGIPLPKNTIVFQRTVKHAPGAGVYIVSMDPDGVAVTRSAQNTAIKPFGSSMFGM